MTEQEIKTIKEAIGIIEADVNGEDRECAIERLSSLLPEPTYWIGDMADDYILAHVGDGKVALIGLQTGNIKNSLLRPMSNMISVSQSELDRICGIGKAVKIS